MFRVVFIFLLPKLRISRKEISILAIVVSLHKARIGQPFVFLFNTKVMESKKIKRYALLVKLVEMTVWKLYESWCIYISKMSKLKYE